MDIFQIDVLYRVSLTLNQLLAEKEPPAMISLKLLETASLEAIYWWNRTEGYYHDHFSRIEKYAEDGELFEFFCQKLFEVFLREYSIRRNIVKGRKAPLDFLYYLKDSRFFSRVADGEIDAIDETSIDLKENSKLTNNRECRSLLSKLAFLINPSAFSLYDQYALESLYQLLKKHKKITRRQLDSYNSFIENSTALIDSNKIIIDQRIANLELFENSSAQVYFSGDNPAFRRRIFDKYLWLYKVNSKETVINNSAYGRFYNYAKSS